MENTSGQGKAAILPEDAKGLAWGAFLLTWVWGIFNRTWLALLTLIPIVGLVVWVMLLIKGREWAWKNKRWDSVEHFNRVQRKWAKAGVILLCIPIIGIIAAIIIPMVMMANNTEVQVVKAPPRAIQAVSPVPPPAIPEAVVAASAPVVLAEQTVVEAASEKIEKAAVVEEKHGGSTMASTHAEAPNQPHKVAKKEVAVLPAEPVSEDVALAPEAEDDVSAVARESYYPAPAGSVVTPKYNDVMTAVIRRDQEAVMQLLDLGWWVDKPRAGGFTPLLEAVSMGNVPMAELLLQRGADPDGIARDLSPLRLAKRNHDVAMEALLREYGATVE